MNSTENKDPFEEFEFKPLTEGLGFQRKKPKASYIHSDIVQDVILKRGEPHLFSPSSDISPLSGGVSTAALGEEPANSAAAATGSGIVEDLILSLQTRNKNLTSPTEPVAKIKASEPVTVTAPIKVKAPFVEPSKTTAVRTPSSSTPAVASQAATSIPRSLARMSYDPSAILLDCMLVLSLNLTCLIALMLITDVDLFGNLLKPDPYGLVYIGLLAMALVNSLAYLVGTRAMVGFTPGEWVFDQRMGTAADFVKSSYVFKIFVRSFCVDSFKSSEADFVFFRLRSEVFCSIFVLDPSVASCLS